MPPIDPTQLAQEMMTAHERGLTIEVLPSARDAEFDLPTAYAVEAELVRMRRAAGHKTAGLKIGYANKAVWRALKMETLVWAHMYDDTVQLAVNKDTVPVGRLLAPKLEPEIVFKLKSPLAGNVADPVGALGAAEWMALGFEIVDCPYPNWKYQPCDFVADFGLHVGLVIGKPRPIEPEMIRMIAGQLADFKLTLLKDGALAAEGVGKSVLRSPALALAELGSAISRQITAEPLGAGEIITTGSTTDAQPIAPGQVWTASVDLLDLPPLTIRTVE